MKKNNITTDELAVMINKGFEKTATKEQFENLDNKVDKLRSWAEVRFDKIEKIILDDHRERIEKL